MNDYEIEELLKQPYNADDVNPVETQDKTDPNRLASPEPHGVRPKPRTDGMKLISMSSK